jgi:hypothetical protein
MKVKLCIPITVGRISLKQKPTHISVTWGTTAVNTAIFHLINVNLLKEKSSLGDSLVSELSFSAFRTFHCKVINFTNRIPNLQNVMENSDY